MPGGKKIEFEKTLTQNDIDSIRDMVLDLMDTSISILTSYLLPNNEGILVDILWYVLKIKHDEGSCRKTVDEVFKIPLTKSSGDLKSAICDLLKIKSEYMLVKYKDHFVDIHCLGLSDIIAQHMCDNF